MTKSTTSIRLDLKEIRDVIIFAGDECDYKSLLKEVNECKNQLIELLDQAETPSELDIINELNERATFYQKILGNIQKRRETLSDQSENV